MTLAIQQCYTKKPYCTPVPVHAALMCCLLKQAVKALSCILSHGTADRCGWTSASVLLVLGPKLTQAVFLTDGHVVSVSRSRSHMSPVTDTILAIHTLVSAICAAAILHNQYTAMHKQCRNCLRSAVGAQHHHKILRCRRLLHFLASLAMSRAW